MDAKRLEYFRELLVRKRESLTHMVQRTEGYGREKEPDTQDMADMAVESYTKEFMFGKSSGDRIILKQIDDAIHRIDTNSYGECTHCEEPIQSKRLEAVPWARHCIECQGKFEKGRLEE
jgi:DnaK suppressor protein